MSGTAGGRSPSDAMPFNPKSGNPDRQILSSQPVRDRQPRGQRRRGASGEGEGAAFPRRGCKTKTRLGPIPPPAFAHRAEPAGRKPLRKDRRGRPLAGQDSLQYRSLREFSRWEGRFQREGKPAAHAGLRPRRRRLLTRPLQTKVAGRAMLARPASVMRVSISDLNLSSFSKLRPDRG